MTKVSLYSAKGRSRGDPKRRVWILRWVGTDGKRYCETIGVVGKLSKRDADARRRDKQSKMDCGVIRPDKPRKMTLSEFLARDREAIQADVQATTLLEYDHAANHAKAALGEGIRLDRIDRAAVGKLKRHLQDLGRKPATIRKTVKAMNTVMSRAVADGLIPSNPFAGQAKGKTQSKAKRVFNAEEVEAMIAVAGIQWWRVFIKLAAVTGLRRGELLNLHWSDIDFDQQTITVTRKDAGRFEVGDESYPVLRWSTKTHEERTVPVPEDALQMLRRFRLASGGSRYIFLSLNRLKAIDEQLQAGTWRPKADLMNNLNRRFTTIQKHARQRLAKRRKVSLDKVEWPLGCLHDLRRTYATEMATHVDLLTLTRWLGHADPATTGQFYHRIKRETEERARQALSALYGAGTDAQVTRSANPGNSPSHNGTENRVPATMNADSACSSIG